MLEFIFYLAILGAILTYIVWGFIISFETMLALNDTKSAIEWIKKHHTPKTFKKLLIIFLSMLHIGYIFLEIIPYFLGFNEKLKNFDIDKVYKKIFKNR